MGKLLELALYNPARLSDEDFLAGFVARKKTAERIASRLREIKSGGLAQHRLIVGQRGMGKTSLLRWIALEVRRDPKLAAVLIPLLFREEQYNVHSLHILWCNCLDALGHYFESCGETTKAQDLDAEAAKLDRAQDKDGNQALSLFRSWMKREKRRPLLLIDNLDIVLEGLPRDGWNLRRVLQDAGGIVVIGGSTKALEVAVDPEAPFYDFFQIDLLEPLNLEEVKDCLRRLAVLRGESGRVVEHLLAADPAKIQVLHDLTGGNPRTLAMLYLVLEESESDDVMADLERLLDQATPLYKARVEELAHQTRVVFDAVALRWDPAVAADIASDTKLSVPTVSTQLVRLVQDGLLGKASLSTTRKVGFQISERFFNIWYLMRHGPRRQRQRLRWLAESLRCLYSPAELESRARAIIENRAASWPSSYCLAFSDALDDGPLKSQLARRAAASDSRLAGDKETAEIEERISALRRAAAVPGARPEAWIALGSHLADVCRLAGAEAAFRKALAIDPASLPARERLGRLLGEQGRLGEAEEVYRQILALEPDHLEALKVFASLAAVRGGFEESERAWQRIAELDPSSALAWQILALLKRDDGRYQEAEAVLRTALERHPSAANLWSLLGNLLADQLGRVAEAEEALRQAISLDPGDAFHQANLGYLLLGEGLLAAAEAPCRAAAAVLPPHGAALLRAFRHLAEGSPERAFSELAAALESGHLELLTIFRDDLLRCLRLAARGGWGDLALRWLDDSGLGDRYRTVRVAYEAYLHGPERLMDVNPEVRAGARRICHELAGDPRRPARP